MTQTPKERNYLSLFIISNMKTNTTPTYLITFFAVIAILSATSARKLEEQPVSAVLSGPSNPTSTDVADATPLPTPTTNADANHDDQTLKFYMHDISDGSHPTAQAVTGIVNNQAANGQIPFAKPNGANLPIDIGLPQDNGNIGVISNTNAPFLIGLSGTTQTTLQINNELRNLPVAVGGQVVAGSVLQKLMFGTMTVIDNELTEGPELASGLLGKAQGFYVASSVQGTSHTMAFTAMLESGNYMDSLSFMGVHGTAKSESQMAIIGGTGKYVNAKGFAITKTLPGVNQQTIDGIETLLECTVFVHY